MENTDAIIKLENIQKTYHKKEKELNVLKNLNVEFYSGQLYAIMGHSGNGKSTLIHILGLIDQFDDGEYHIYSQNVKNLNDKESSYIRMKNIGFVFQEFNLVPTLKAYENVMVTMLINDEIKPKERKIKAIELLSIVGLKDRINHFPKELSGGEQQRVALARALANNPNIILADEPTGNLDEKSEKDIFLLLKELAQNGKCVIVVSHSSEIKKYADKVYILDNGKLEGEN